MENNDGWLLLEAPPYGGVTERRHHTPGKVFVPSGLGRNKKGGDADTKVVMVEEVALSANHEVEANHTPSTAAVIMALKGLGEEWEGRRCAKLKKI